jgi:hypothetical protein
VWLFLAERETPMTEALRAVGVIVTLLGGAAVFMSLVGPQYPLMATAEPSLNGVWRGARRWGIVLACSGLALVLLSRL